MKIRVILFSSLLLLLTTLNILTPTRIFSSKENRYLQTFPKLTYETLLSTKFGQEFDEYANDQFVFRDKWITMKTLTDLSLGKQNNGRVYFGKDGFLFDMNTDFDDKYFNQNLEYIKQFINDTKKDQKIITMLIPGKSYALSNYLPKHAPTLDELSIKQKIKYNLKSVLNLEETLKNNPSFYYKTDHHWTLDGAYQGYVELMKLLNLVPAENNKTLVNQDFQGTQYRKANYYKYELDKIYKYNVDYDKIESITIDGKSTNNLYDESHLDKTDKYSYYLGGDAGLIEINTNIDKGSILIIKDSFANSLIPFLINNFNKIIVIDPRYYKDNIVSLINENNIDEIVILFNVENFGKRGRFESLGRR